ncbi:MAG: heptaprenylglyceryl phosphate synthase [Clostridia bacterium]|jgi:putative glycerol-1-phosphate prenyltransferase|nr:geranylgeranylglyceryl/heptaprenylglyceryl phosphate synthase [Clostridiales bacterium]MDK2986480.1 heptaprenylglyceryl phosphate synthase [Clostridia bacterium]
MVVDNWKQFRIVVKLDPDKKLSREALQVLKIAEIDAIIIGGTQNITMENSLNLLEEILHCGYRGPIFHEISEKEVILTEVTGYLIPVVLNAGELLWLRDAHLKAITTYGQLIPWTKVTPVGYLVCNPDAAVAHKTKSRFLDLEEAISYLILAEKIFNFSIFYIEYSGIYGDLNLISEVAAKRDNIHIIYGGGIETIKQAQEILEYVDTIVIGNLMYRSPKNLLDITEALGKKIQDRWDENAVYKK